MDGSLKIETSDREPQLASLPKSLSDDFRKRLGENLKLTDEQEKRLKGWLKKRIDEWKSDSSELHDRLIWDNELCEGIVEPTDFPFEGASNAHVPITETHMEVYRSIQKRSILGADQIWTAETESGDLQLEELAAQVSSMMNYKARNEWNIEDCIKDVFWAVNRDALAAIQAVWAEEYEKARDIVLVTGLEDFITQFPNAEEAGISAEEYRSYALQASVASDEFPLEIPISFEKVNYRGVKGCVVERVDYVKFPATAPSIHDEICRGYGKRYTTRKGVLRKKAKDGVFYRDAVEKVIKGSNRSDVPEFRQAQWDIEGLSKENTSDDVEVYELVIKGKLNGVDSDEDEMKYLVSYAYDNDQLLQCMEYPYRVDFYATFRIDRRPNQDGGKSVPQKTRDMNDIIDTLFNQRINSNTIASVPTFKALASKKKELDPVLRENKWGPGRIFWVSDFNSFDQFRVQPTDMGQSAADQEMAASVLDKYLGSPIALLSGQAPSEDPDAPGNKTAMLINQSNLRMEDPLDELRDGVEELGNICLSHLYQFGPPILEFQEAIEEGGAIRRTQRTVHKKYLRTGLRMKMTGVTVAMNPDAEFAKAVQHHTILLNEPAYAQNGMLRVEGLRRAFRKGRVSDRERLLPPMEAVEKMEIELRKKAMMEIEAEKSAAAQQAAKENVKGAIQSVRTADQVEKAALELAQRGLGRNGTA